MDGKVTSPHSYWSQSHSEDEMMPVVFDAVRSKGCSFETLNTVSHLAAGKAIGIVKQAMNSGCYKWNVSYFLLFWLFILQTYIPILIIYFVLQILALAFVIAVHLPPYTACEIDEEIDYVRKSK